MIVCPRCSKENQDHYKFCLGCGAELPRDAAQAPKSFTAPTPPAGFPVPSAQQAPAPRQAAGPSAPQFGAQPQIQSAPMPAPVAAAPAPMQAQFGGAAAPAAVPAAAAQVPAGGFAPCPKCGNRVPAGFKFCGTCGQPMAAAAAGAAPAQAPVPVAAPLPVGPSASTGTLRGSLVLIRSDGTEGDSFPLHDTTPVGREAGGVFSSDSYLSPKHATFAFRGAQLFVKDEQSLNGVYMKIERDVPTELQDGSIFRIGQEVLRFERVAAPTVGPDGVEVMGSPNPGYLGRVSLVIGRETTGNAFPVPPAGMHMGRERGDIIFPEDGYVSGLHCRIHGEGGRVLLTDVGSSNGTFVRIKGESPMRSGDMVLMGQQLFRAQF